MVRAEGRVGPGGDLDLPGEALRAVSDAQNGQIRDPAERRINNLRE
jgi:hypothetical protein